jgi:hypothetical protein
MELSYIIWSTLNCLAMLAVGLHIFARILSIFLDLAGAHKAAGQLFFGSLGMGLWPVFFVVVTRGLGVNIGYFP